MTRRKKKLNFDFFFFIISIGDEIIAINGRQVEGLSHAEVVALFREVRRGMISIQLGRKLPKDRDGLYVTADQLPLLTQLPLSAKMMT